MEHQHPLAYPYRELIESDIRFLKVEPGELGSPIKCQLYQLPLTEDEHVDFFALSYVWGDPTVTKPITLNGEPFEVTANLYSALDQLRSSVNGFTEKFVWIDAICINQADIPEKERQIPRMADIYRFTSRSLGWLGPVDSPKDDSAEDDAFEHDASEDDSAEVDSADDDAFEHNVSEDEAFENEAFADDAFEDDVSDDDISDDEAFADEAFGHDVSEDDAVEKIFSVAVFFNEILADHMADEPSSSIQRILSFYQCSQPLGVNGINAAHVNDETSFFIRRTMFFHQCSRLPRIRSFFRFYRSSLAAIVDRTWFKRRWIVQEICLPEQPPDLCLGRHIINFETLRTLHDLAETESANVGAIKFSFGSLGGERDKYRALVSDDLPETQPSRVLLEMLLHTSAEATNLHDYIYSLLGLCNFGVNNEIPNSLRPEYAKPFQRAWYDAVVYIITTTGDLRLLNSNGTRLSGVPPWVHDFRELTALPSNPPFADATSVALSNDGMSLHVKGIQLGACVVALPYSDIPTDCVEWLYRRVEEIEDLFSRASIALDIPSNVLYDTWSQHVFTHGPIKNFLLTDARALYGQLRDQIPINLEHPGNNYHVLMEVLTLSFAVMHDGSVVTTPRVYTLRDEVTSIQKGDIITLFLGAESPSVIRPTGVGYEMVLFCNISGNHSINPSSEEYWGQQELQNFVLV